MFCPFADTINAEVLENTSRYTQPSANQLVPSVIAAVRTVKQHVTSVPTFSLNVSSLLKDVPALASVDESRARTILPKEEFDVNKPGFAPAPAPSSSSTSQWISSLSENEFYALAVAVVVGPLIASYGLTTLFKKYQKHKMFKMAANGAKAYLRRCATFNPSNIPCLLPVVPPSSSAADQSKPFPLPYPYLQEPSRVPGISRDWRNMDIASVQAALDRVSRMSDEELSFFHNAFTRWAHVPDLRLTIDRTVKWVVTGEVTLDDARRCTVPQAAIKDLPMEQRRILKAEGWETKIVKGQDADVIRAKIEEARKKEQGLKEADALKMRIDSGDGPKPVQ